MSKAFFIPNDGRQPIEVSCENDIRNYMGDVIEYFETIEIHDSHVLINKGGQFIQIGRMEYE